MQHILSRHPLSKLYDVTDPSKWLLTLQSSQRACEWAVENIYKKGDELHLFHVIPPGNYMLLSPDMGMDGIIEEDEETRRNAVSASCRVQRRETTVCYGSWLVDVAQCQRQRNNGTSHYLLGL